MTPVIGKVMMLINDPKGKEIDRQMDDTKMTSNFEAKQTG